MIMRWCNILHSHWSTHMIVPLMKNILSNFCKGFSIFCMNFKNSNVSAGGCFHLLRNYGLFYTGRCFTKRLHTFCHPAFYFADLICRTFVGNIPLLLSIRPFIFTLKLGHMGAMASEIASNLTVCSITRPAENKENIEDIKDLHYCPCLRGTTGDRSIPYTKGQ